VTGKRSTLLSLAGVFTLSLFFLAYPLYVIRPFRHQGPHELQVALTILHWRPGVEMVCAVTALFATYLYWRAQPKMLRKIGVAVAAASVCLFAGLSRINIFEAMMFHPVDHPAFSSVQETKLDGEEMVMAVNLAGQARAYPIRSVSYHHIVNDEVGGVAIVATY
jgi:hypothetical protein